MPKYFEKGKLKTGGRKPGTSNILTTDKKEFVNEFLDRNREKFEADFLKLEPVDRVRLYIKLLEFVLPKQKEVSLNGGLHVTWNETLSFENEAEMLTASKN